MTDNAVTGRVGGVMKVLTIRQPWAWAIINSRPPKDIENRGWSTKYRGPLLIQASARSPQCEADCSMLRARGVWLPESFEAGGIIGIVDLVDCVRHHSSEWFTGPIGWVLRDPRPLPLIPIRGMQTLFRAPDEVVERVLQLLSIPG